MRSRLQASVVLLLCCLATGSQWDLLQVFAWGRMAVDYSRSMSVCGAVAKTFDGEMCPICRIVADAKQDEQKRSGLPQLEIKAKPVLFLQEAPVVFLPRPAPQAWFSGRGPVLTVDRSAPPVPPPRAACA